MIKLLMALTLLAQPGIALGKTFECGDPEAAVVAVFSDKRVPILVVVTINPDGKGTIEVADRKFEADYQVQGLTRTWRFFTDEDQEFGYLFLIQPDGAAAYFDHETSKGESTPPDQEYFCNEL